MVKEVYFEKIAIDDMIWLVQASENALKRIDLIDKADSSTLHETPNDITNLTIRQLKEYFIGNRAHFDIPLDISGYSTFSQKIWNILLTIPYGKTISYKELAYRTGDVKCIRAAATANGRNPIPIIIPCHRVIGSDGGLTGYSLGLDIKKYLLNIEQPGRYSDVQMQHF
ncbi:MAG TPA: methylated-DNA--[protein]-cysteine S-methyltransferase [Saprospiraceae bacterium]|nr:methylated-DNA--[protein]-cysteine S-methyltransferase [Saprospiraceae bacterium]HRO09362.1 methylated-DNA--[protein]-cysteine S-methyltransferase [Saprospiraceae bacterium]HRO72762.1 methylated-DNA--[protein]-cysteine S-methyltransferase [Saprospiraceae bacterium]HRP42663.1 methylated-DNA--[protein]-cysteine S-methyltransferase [Saprospiraceae bacterium]